MQAQGLQTALAAIYPPRCLGCGVTVGSEFGLCGPCWRDTPFIAGAICDSCSVPLPGPGEDGLTCDACMAGPPPWRWARSALIYDGTGRKLILALKHGDRQEIAQPAGRWMVHAMGDRTLAAETLVAPVPLHWTRTIKRRYNQSALLARSVARQLGLSWCPNLLQRVRRTVSLDGLGREERFALLQGSMRIHPRHAASLAGRPVLLVDDVLTSGATLLTAARCCRDAGSGEIAVATLARVAKET